jgi:isoleucyl-tRNA synthetase
MSQKSMFSQIEEDMAACWSSEAMYEQSLKLREGAPEFSFYDGPPFANGLPHHGHVVPVTIKDSITRYKTMRGFYVPRRTGYDCHGLPIENKIEKEHGFKNKQDIVAYGIDKFNNECRESVFMYKGEWNTFFKRLGRWADYNNSYATMDETYIESVWWVFKELYDKGLVYKDFRSAPYCPRCATPLSNFEVNQGYQDNVSDPSLFVKFKLTDEDAYLLGWTTTPWSTPGNAAIAVLPEADYIYATATNDEGVEETLIIAKSRAEVLDTKYKVEKTVKGSELVGRSYVPLYALSDIQEYEGRENLYKVWGADFVSIEDGTGVLHVAPAFGEDDLKLGKSNNIPVISTIDENGKVKAGIGLPEHIEGKFFKNADRLIIEELTKRGLVFAAETIQHTYPFCWRCDTPLLYYATTSWMISVTKIKKKLLKNNQQINWQPNHLKDGRFGKWLDGARDWAFSRNRFWGAPIPIWETEDGETIVVGSIEELRKLAVNPEKIGDLHRPSIDDVEITLKNGKTAKRIPEVFDCWFESGSMPYAQSHYPFEDKKKWAETYPADFIAEAIDQTRGWFYTLHVLASALFDKPAFKNVITSGWVVAADGQKLSKRLKNYSPLDEVFDQFGADVLRFFMMSSPVVHGEDVRFSSDHLKEVQRNVFMTLWNSYKFFKMYADIDQWKPTEKLVTPESRNALDAWIVARVQQTIKEVTDEADAYKIDRAVRPITLLIDDLSNWYIRRSRRRFWKSDNTDDKQQAYTTLHWSLIKVCQLLAPWSPFISDSIYRELTQGTSEPASVHLTDWPEVDSYDEAAVAAMAKVRDIINEGLSQRAAAGIKVRQPLADINIPHGYEAYEEIIADELNVKAVRYTAKKVLLDTTVTHELKAEGFAREIVRHVQNARKLAGLDVENRIVLSLSTENELLSDALENNVEMIANETLATKVSTSVLDYAFTKEVKVDDCPLRISLEKDSDNEA